MRIAPHMIDAYKLGHREQYPDGTTLVFSGWTPRKSRVPGIDKVILFGLQAALGKISADWQRWFDRPLSVAIDQFRRRMNGVIPGVGDDVGHLIALHHYGKLPIEVWALPEGTAVPIGVPMAVLWNTRPEFFWVTNYLETALSAELWGPCTSATLAKEYRKILLGAAERTGGSKEFVDWQGHDFSYRGMYGTEAAAMSGAGHLLSFNGTDTIPAIDFLEEYYYATPEETGGSVTATEHSVMCMGTQEAEIDTFRRLLQHYPTGVISIVSDTWDYWKVLTDILPQLKDEIMARDGKLVIRPDSGVPEDIICGTCVHEDDPKGSNPIPDGYSESEFRGSYRILWDIFGGTRNSLGYKELDPHVGLIYGDAISLDRCKQICFRLQKQGFVPNMVFGIGSFSYQYQTRDSFGFALKSTYGEVNGEPREIFKDPKTDSGEKRSARGLLAVDSNLKLHQGVTWNEVKNCAFKKIYQDGRFYTIQSLNEIRARVRA